MMPIAYGHQCTRRTGGVRIGATRQGTAGWNDRYLRNNQSSSRLEQTAWVAIGSARNDYAGFVSVSRTPQSRGKASRLKFRSRRFIQVERPARPSTATAYEMKFFSSRTYSTLEAE
jgi:hypothetical protein